MVGTAAAFRGELFVAKLISKQGFTFASSVEANSFALRNCHKSVGIAFASPIIEQLALLLYSIVKKTGVFLFAGPRILFHRAKTWKAEITNWMFRSVLFSRALLCCPSLCRCCKFLFCLVKISSTGGTKGRMQILNKKVNKWTECERVGAEKGPPMNWTQAEGTWQTSKAYCTCKTHLEISLNFLTLQLWTFWTLQNNCSLCEIYAPTLQQKQENTNHSEEGLFCLVWCNQLGCIPSMYTNSAQKREKESK